MGIRASSIDGSYQFPERWFLYTARHCSMKRAVSIVTCAMLACSVLGDVSVQLHVDADTPLHTVDQRFLCFNIDTGSLFNGIDFSDPLFRAYTSQLAPAIVRIGGTAVDYSYYFPDVPYLVGQPNECAVCGSGASAIGNDMSV